jgi:DNA primase
MAGRIPQSFIDELIARSDIVEVIGSRVQLKKAGREWKACCPFHGEKTPSFWVSPEKQFYHCFGCGAHGTVLGFLMEHDRLPFPDAVDDLAGRLGLEVPREDDGRGGGRERPFEDLYGVMERAADIYRQALRAAPRAQEYLKNRGLTGDTCARFGIGYAPNAWDTVLKQLGGGEEPNRALLAAGLVIERERGGGFYDRFRDRIMFPIRDARGRTIAFGGRIIDQGEPKYLNSPETPLFHKGRELYGLFETRKALRQIDRLMVVEGYMDVVRLSQAGIAYAVATLGTSTTPEHLNRLFRLTSEVVFCFDGDRAGRAAAWRALENSLAHAREGRQLRFLFLPDGHDPDTLVGEEGRERFESRLAAALPLSEFLVRQLVAQVELGSVDGRARLAELARPLLARLPPGVYRELMIDRLAQEVRMPAPRLAELLALDGAGAAAVDMATAPHRTARARPQSPGRKPLLTQAIMLVLHHPSAARAVRNPEGLRGTQRGAEVLAELLETLHEEPELGTAQLIERWRDRPEGPRLNELAATPSLVPDPAGAERELAMAVERLIEAGGPGRRLEELLAKAEQAPLESEEKQELQDLLAARKPAAPPPGGGFAR